MPFERKTAVIMLNLKFIIYDMCLCFVFVLLTHRSPLEWGKWLWNEERGTCTYGNTSMTVLGIHAVIIHRDFLCKMSNTLNIFFRFCRKSHHKVKLYLAPAAFKRLHRTVKNYFFGKSLINYITHSLRPSFWCKSKAALSYILYFTHNI